MARKQSSLVLACSWVISVSSCGSAQQQGLEIPFFGVFIVTDGIPTATMEMCRRTHKPVFVVHCIWSVELRGSFLSWLSAKISYISVLVSCLVSSVFWPAPRGNISCAFLELYSCVIVTPGAELPSCWKTGACFLVPGMKNEWLHLPSNVFLSNIVEFNISELVLSQL